MLQLILELIKHNCFRDSGKVFGSKVSEGRGSVNELPNEFGNGILVGRRQGRR
jgi:hypothetical protein